MTAQQQQALETSVATIGFFKTSNTIRDLYNAGTIRLSQARACFRFLRKAQVRDLGTVSSFLWRI